MIENTPRHTNPIIVLFAAMLLFVGCQTTAYYDTLEKFGIPKRDLLVERVEKARDTQEDAKEQFKSALEQFSAVVNFEGGELKQRYDQFSADLEQSESKAAAVRDRINSVESVAKALFEEWEAELKQYSNENMRQVSQQKLTETQQQYDKLIGAMKQAEQKIEPVLTLFRDQVLFLKHNLNAQAIASIQGELVAVESNVASLIKEMETSIQEANTFINAMNKDK
jgi:MFS superfamily sulfate permease-like transporter